MRLEKVDAAIATMRELFHLPNGTPAAKVREPKHSAIRKTRVPAETNGKGKGATLKAAIRAALERGPMTPADLAAKVGLKRAALLLFARSVSSSAITRAIGLLAVLNACLPACGFSWRPES